VVVEGLVEEGLVVATAEERGVVAWVEEKVEAASAAASAAETAVETAVDLAAAGRVVAA